MASDPWLILERGLVGRYVLERELGRGGMATVYLARDMKHERPVALKVLRAELAVSLGPERFRREIALAARLQHPHICSVYDSGDCDGLLWFTMPFVHGETLRERLRRETCLPLDEALRIARESAQALAYAHRHNVVHRDVKPENILLAEDGSTLVADFGVARALEAPLAPNLTETGYAVGTPAYMAPEQAFGAGTIDGRADQYSLAVVCYEMLTGTLPFTGGTPAAVIAERLRGSVPSARTRRPELSAEGDAAIQRALAADPEERFPTMAGFARALTGSGQDTPNTPQRGTVTSTLVAPVAPTHATRALTGSHAIATSKRRIAAMLAGASALVVILALVIARRSSPKAIVTAGETAPSATRLAVLPFENVGDSAEGYFADGITDAVREKLTAISGLEVIASTSSLRYRNSTKSPSEIGRDLGVEYLVVGTIRWANERSGTKRVQVRPQLVEAASATDRWEQSFDAPVTDVFRVQSDIASRVADRLRITLAATDSQAIADQPTRNPEAYAAFLRGEQARNAGESSANFRRAVSAYREAVRLDSTFALAWAHLAGEYSAIYGNVRPDARIADSARAALDRATRLAPERAWTHAAAANYWGLVHRDVRRAMTEDSLALARAPHDPRFLGNVAEGELSLGRWDAALAHQRQAFRLDPRSDHAASDLGRTQLRLRHYPEARAALDQALAIAPGKLRDLQNRAMIQLAQGDLAGARAVLRAAPPTVDRAALVASMGTYNDVGWALDSIDSQQLLELRPSAFDDNRATWALALAEQYGWRGEDAQARSYADSAIRELEPQLAAAPDEVGLVTGRAIALAHLGRSAEAIREIKRAAALLPVEADYLYAPYQLHAQARVQVMAGDYEGAIDTLERLLSIPYIVSPGWLRIDPSFARLRGNPRFERLTVQR